MTDPHATNLEQAFRVAAMAKKLGLKIRNSSEEYVASLSRDELDQLTKESRLIESCKSREERRAAIEASPAFRRATESIRVRIVRGQLLVEEFDSMDTTAYHVTRSSRSYSFRLKTSILLILSPNSTRMVNSLPSDEIVRTALPMTRPP